MRKQYKYPSDLGTVQYPIAIAGYQLYVHTIPKEINNYGYDKYYVGITGVSAKSRWHGGSGYTGQVFGDAIKKYGAENVQHLVMYEHLISIDANILEQIMIRAIHSHISEHGYNISWGGEGTSKTPSPNRKDITDVRFGKLIAKYRIGTKPSADGTHYRSMWYCECDCGGNAIVMLDNLLRYLNTKGQKGTGSCGCMSSRNFGTPKPNHYIFYDDYVDCYCNNGDVFKIDIEDYEKIKHRTWRIEKKFNHVFADQTYNYDRQRIESIILDVPTHNIDKLRLKYKNGDPRDVRKSNLIIYQPQCDNIFEYNYFIHNVVTNGICFDHGNTWIVGRRNEKRHSVYGLENALKEYKERYGDDFLNDYLIYKERGENNAY